IRDRNVTGVQTCALPILALGGLEKGVSPYQMASAYTAFANNGVRYEPHLITKIEDASGKVIVDNTHIKHKRIMSKKIAKEMTSKIGRASCRKGMEKDEDR